MYNNYSMFISCTVKIVFICVYYTSPMFFFIPELLKSFTELTTFSDTIYSLTHTHTYTHTHTHTHYNTCTLA